MLSLRIRWSLSSLSFLYVCVLPSPPLLSPPLLSICQTDRSSWLTCFREVKLRWCHLDRQSGPVNRAGMASGLWRITLGWQRCKVMSACGEIIMWAHLPACDVSMALPWLGIVELFPPITLNEGWGLHIQCLQKWFSFSFFFYILLCCGRMEKNTSNFLSSIYTQTSIIIKVKWEKVKYHIEIGIKTLYGDIFSSD